MMPNDYPSMMQMLPAILAFISSAATLGITRYIDAKNREAREKKIEDFRQRKNQDDLSSLVNLQIKDILLASESYREEVKADMDGLKNEILITKNIHEKKMADIIYSYENQIEELRKRINEMSKLIEELKAENQFLKKKKLPSNTRVNNITKKL